MHLTSIALSSLLLLGSGAVTQQPLPVIEAVGKGHAIGHDGCREGTPHARAAVNSRDAKGQIAIEYADAADVEIIEILKKAGSLNRTGHSGRTVCDAERALSKLGYDLPVEECIAGRQLRTIVTKFRQEHALTTTGELDSSTLKASGVQE
jgi:hypothetical protein